MRPNVIRSILAAVVLIVACSESSTEPEELSAAQAYASLEPIALQAIDLAFKGFNESTTQSLPVQTVSGVQGTMVIAGQVDQGASTNKTLQLTMALSGFSRVGGVAFTTFPGTHPTLTMSLTDIPTGTFEVELLGPMRASGQESVGVYLTMTGTMQSDGMGGVRRVPGSTRLVGAVSTLAGTLQVDVTR